MEAAHREFETNSPPHFCMKRLAPSALCALLLGMVLSACSPSERGHVSEPLYGAVTVMFDKNNHDAGSTEADPDNITIKPPATTLSVLPKEPTRPGYTFVEWNMQKVGEGVRFDENTRIEADVLLTVYARWKADGKEEEEDLLPQVRTVVFNKNEGDTEAVPSSKTVTSPATTLDSLPAEPTRVGYTFVEWNTQPDGKGDTFNTQTPIRGDVLWTVYAQWARNLDFHLSLGAATLTPMPGERLATFSVRVSGFKSEEDADSVAFEINPTEGLVFGEITAVNTSTPGSRVFSFTAEYDGKKAFPDGFAPVQINLTDMPQGYAYGQPIRITLIDGQEKSRPIPVNAYNIETFNEYASTEGLEWHYQLIGDVHLAPPAPGQSNWTPIGTESSPFIGSFDGGGNIIFGLTINSSSDYQGLFGYIGYFDYAVVENLGLEEVSVTGNHCVAGLAGVNASGWLQNCYVTGSVKGNGSIGGLMGCGEFGRVQNSYARCDVEGTNSIGGLVGSLDGSVENSYAMGNVKGNDKVGGLVGSTWGLVENSYATGNVEGTGNDIGGLVGENANGGWVENSYATGSVTGNNYVGGVVGSNRSGRLHNSVALNPSVIATGANVGRVTADNNTSNQSGNYAREGMKLKHNNGTDYVPTGYELTHVGRDGADTSDFHNKSFWTSTLSSWDFSENGPWEWKAGFLPTLRAVGGEQTPEVRPLPP